MELPVLKIQIIYLFIAVFMRETSLVFDVEDGVLEPEVLREPLVDPVALAEEPRVGGGPQALLHLTKGNAKTFGNTK